MKKYLAMMAMFTMATVIYSVAAHDYAIIADTAREPSILKVICAMTAFAFCLIGIVCSVAMIVVSRNAINGDKLT